VHEFGGYDLDGLIKTWGNGWESLEELCEQSRFNCIENKERLESYNDCLYCQTIVGFNAVLTEFSLENIGTDFFVCTMSSFFVLRGFWGESSLDTGRGCQHNNGTDKEAKNFNKTLKDIVKYFSKCNTIGDVLLKIKPKEIDLKFFDTEDMYWVDRIKDIKISEPYKAAFNWLLYGLKSKKASREAWWNCVWIFMEPKINELRNIEKRIKTNIPLTDEQNKTLQDYMIYSNPTLKSIKDDKKLISYKVFLKVQPDSLNMSPINAVCYTLLAMPAYELAKKLEEEYKKGYYHAKCHAPSCGKRFLTRVPNATSCPGSRSDKKSKCSLEWIRYARRLKDLGKSPKDYWDNQEHKDQFIKGDTKEKNS